MKNQVALSLLLSCLISGTAHAGKGSVVAPCPPKAPQIPLPADIMRAAMPGQATPAGFCADPYLSICASYGGGNEYREKNFRRFMDEASAHALELLAKKHGLDQVPASVKAPEELKKTLAKLALIPGAIAEYEALRTRYTTDRYQAIERDTMSTYAEYARGYELKAVDAQMAAGKLSWASAQLMKAAIIDTKVLLDFDIDAMPSIIAASRDALATAYSAWCGADHMGDNAFQTSVGGQRVVIFCAGTFLRAEGSGEDRVKNFRNIFGVIGHELGHTIDPGPFPKTYEKYMSCVANGNIDGMTSTGGTFTGSTDEIEAQLRGNISASHRGEIVADFWSAQAAVAYFNEAPQLGAQERFDMLRQSWSLYCGSGDDGNHPLGHYRIANVLGLDPGIRKALGCQDAPAKEKACAIQ
ncbi:MAG: hypothetical protein HY074_09390 [Deltaproteobacteria bacterium]|nr:hypothetical protein [Deltaproteobacteria bacterium]